MGPPVQMSRQLARLAKTPPFLDSPSSLSRLWRYFQARRVSLRLAHLGLVGSQQRKMWRSIRSRRSFSAVRRCFLTTSLGGFSYTSIDRSGPCTLTADGRTCLMRRLLLPLLSLLLLATTEPAGIERVERPNVLLILTDDQTVESMRVMEKTLRLLGEEGTTFRNSFVSTPLCCPSRATLLTGQYAHNHGVLGNKSPEGG